jgi:hypothetical protein
MDGETQVVQRRRSRVSWMHTGVWIKVIFQIPYREIPLNREIPGQKRKKPATQVTGFLNSELLVSYNAY